MVSLCPGAQCSHYASSSLTLSGLTFLKHWRASACTICSMQAASSSLCTQQVQQQQQQPAILLPPTHAYSPHPSASLVLQAIEELPGQESPEIFGLHPNADLTFRTLQVQAAVQIIMDTRPKGGGSGGGLSREEVVDRICEDLLSKVGPAVCGKPSYPVCGDHVAIVAFGDLQMITAETLKQPPLAFH